jgi:hypothetical protein
MDYKKLYESALNIIKTLEITIEELNKGINSTNIRLLNCQNALEINKEIVRNTILDQNRIQQEYANEIDLLKTKLKLLDK